MVNRLSPSRVNLRLIITVLCSVLLYPPLFPVLAQDMPEPLPPEPLPVVSLSTSTTFREDPKALIENQGTDLTFRVDLDVPAPENGLRIFIDSNVEQMLNRLDLPGFAFGPRTENIQPSSIRTSFDNSGFAFTLDEGAMFGTFTIEVFDNPEPDTFRPDIFDGLVEATFFVKLQSDLTMEDERDIRDVSLYNVSPNACGDVVRFADDASQIPLPGPRVYDEAIDGDISGDMANPIVMPLSEGTHIVTVTSMTGDPEYVMMIIPEGFELASIILNDFISDFDGTAFAAVQNGCRFTEPRRMTNVANILGYTHFGPESLTAPVGSDILDDMSVAEGAIGFDGPLPSGIYTFWLQQTGAASTSTLAFNVQASVLRVADNDSDTIHNDTIASAQPTGLDAMNTQVVAEGRMTARAGDPNTAIEATADVDMYAFSLNPGETVALDLDSIPIVLGGVEQRMSGELRLFDATGQALAQNSVGAAPGEDPSNDAYLEFTAPAAGIYYVGVSQYLNTTYDPNIVGSGKGMQSFQDGISPGPYTLDITLRPVMPAN